MLLLKLRKETVTFQTRLESYFLGHRVCRMAGSVFCLNWGDVIWQKRQNAEEKQERGGHSKKEDELMDGRKCKLVSRRERIILDFTF